VTATRTSLAAEARIDLDEGDSRSLALVSEEEFELVKCPTVEFGSHRPIETVSSPANSCEVFAGKCLLSVERELNQIDCAEAINLGCARGASSFLLIT
jgi:hypothetical protein